MSINDLLNPPAIVRPIEDVVDVWEWHQLAKDADILKNKSSLNYAKAFYNIKKNDNFKKLGHNTLYEYVYKEFAKSKSWVDKLILIHEKFVLQLNVDPKTLEEVTFGKLSKLVAHVTEDNVQEILKEAKELTQSQIDDKYQAKECVEDPDAPKNKKISFSGPEDMVEVVNTALELAADELCNIPNSSFKYPNEVPDLLRLEYVVSNYMASTNLDGDAKESLDRTLKRLERIHKIKITWEPSDG